MREAINQREGSDETIDVKPIAGILGKALKGMLFFFEFLFCLFFVFFIWNSPPYYVLLVDYSGRNATYLNLAEMHWALLGAQFSSKGTRFIEQT